MEKDANKKKNAAARRLGVKTAALVLVLGLALGSVIGGTAAWLSARTAPVVNTFTYGDIDVTLTETDTGDDDGDPNTNEYKMLPGRTITKDPEVTVLKDSEECWLFVKLERSDNFDDFMTYEMADGWEALEGEEGVYYRRVSGAGEDQKFAVLKDHTVTVKETVTKEMLNELDKTAGEEHYPVLTITAYAVQYDDEAIDSAEKAWSVAAQSEAVKDEP